jgi:hypothetical protein
MEVMAIRWQWIRALALITLAACGSNAAGPPDSAQPAVCHGGCLCFATEAQCVASGCYVEYDRSADGSQHFSGCLNGAPIDGSVQ